MHSNFNEFKSETMDIREYFQKEQIGFYKVITENLTTERRKQLYDAINDWHENELKLLGIANVIISLPEHEKWIKISDAINKAKKKRQEQGFQLGVIKGSLYSMGFEDAIEWLLGNEL